MRFARLSGSIAMIALVAFLAITPSFWLGSHKSPLSCRCAGLARLPARSAFAGVVFIAWASWGANFWP